MKKIILTFLLISISLISFAQLENVNIKKTQLDVLKKISNKNYDDALEILIYLKEIDTNQIMNYNYLIGMCYISTENFKEKALLYLLKADNHESKTFVLDYYIGRAYLINGDKQKAFDYLNKYIKNMRSLELKGFRFKKSVFENDDISIHFQKSSEDVVKLLSQYNDNINLNLTLK